MRTRRALITTAAVAAALAAACGGSRGATHAPHVDPATFSTDITNPYWPLKPGAVFVYEGTKDGKPQRDVVTVTHDTRMVMGVRTVVVHDVVSIDGKLAEDTFDWYAQAADGSVWYFGEDSSEIATNGKRNKTGSWEAGVDGAEPGVIMPAHPVPGRTYRQEYKRGEAEDQATILRQGERASVPAGAYDNVLVTKEFTRLEPDVLEHKAYAPGVGLITEDAIRGDNEHMQLVSVTGT
jgi:hypothetical protein